ncbi:MULTISPECIES: hypothetical protein [unclassified Dietzia]|uniref:hypothetical protein n=1 Tax=unclassified Dietzia TaxID=2617939 RepID=UPI000D21D43F|nr:MULTISPECIES: hypothetical protein [unclassified Dietzia]AVZ38592.1 hypothetical protein CT688_02945 [Dietzia sp. JS16-p6b]
MHEPQGSLPREVYVRRRVAAVAIAVVAVLAVVLALFLASRDSGTDTQDSATGGEVDSAEPATTTETTTTETTRDDGGASRGRCADEDLSLEVWPAEPNVAVGQDVRFFVNILNTSDTTCDRDLSEAPLSFEVYRLDTNVKVWSSIDCTTPREDDEVELRPGEPEPRQIDWTGRRSAEGACTEADRTPVEVGAYQVYALVGNVFSPAATFNVVEGG